MAVVETRKLTKVFKRGNVGAVNDVDLESREGEFLVLLGPSGSGKTTLLRMIAGFEIPTSGRIVSPYPNAKARTIARTIDGSVASPRIVAITSPRTSPIAQPVRQ